MRLLLANPNTTAALTDRMANVARAAAAPGGCIHVSSKQSSIVKITH